MKTYPKYKESGIPWIGQIPEGWNVGKIKFLCDSIFAGATPSTDNESYWNGDIPWIPSGCCHDCNINEAPKYITQDGYNHSSTKMIPSGTTVMALTGATCALLGYLTISACANQSVVAFIENNKKANSRYLYYSLLSARTDILSRKTGGAQGGINVGDCANIEIPIIPLAEQQAIAEYLDKKTGNIDELVGLLNKQIADVRAYRQSLITETVIQGLNKDVPMKNSGVEWIGQIPEGWKVLKLKLVSEICGRIGYRGYTASDLVEQGEGAITLSPSNIQDNKMTYQKCSYVSWNKYEESPEIQVHDGDILFTKTGSSYGKSAYVDYLPMEATINPQLVVIKCKNSNPKFISYTLQTSIISTQVELSVVGGTIPTISQEAIGSYHLPIPPLSEQQQIVEFLDAKTKDIDELLSKLEAQVADLLAFKSSLISEVVTGKIDIR